MMRFLHLLCLLFALPLFCRAQDVYQGLPIDSVTHKITFTGVVQVPGATKAELYARAREWAALTFRSAKDVIQMDDKEAGVLIAKGCYVQNFYFITASLTTYYWHTIKLEIKDGRYRYTITDFYLEGNKLIGVPNAAEDQLRVASKNPGSGVKTNKPKGIYAHRIDGIRGTGETESASLAVAMAGTAKKDF